MGGAALYLIGNSLFKRLSAPYFPLSRSFGIGPFALLSLAAAATPPLLSAAASAVPIVMAA